MHGQTREPCGGEDLDDDSAAETNTKLIECKLDAFGLHFLCLLIQRTPIVFGTCDYVGWELSWNVLKMEPYPHSYTYLERTCHI